jgi:hypothetical protein
MREIFPVHTKMSTVLQKNKDVLDIVNKINWESCWSILVINSNDIVVFITNKYKLTFYLDQLSFLQLNINNNATPIYS